MKITSFYDLEEFDLIDDYDKNNRDIRLYELKNVILDGISFYYPNVLLKQSSDNFYILPLKEMTMSLNKKSYYEENGMFFDSNIKNSNVINIQDPVYYFIYNTENYFHFIYDTLPYLYLFLKIRKENPKLKLLMNFNSEKSNNFLPFIIEALEVLNINRDDIIVHNKSYIYDKIYLSSSLTHNGLSNNPPRKEIFEIYNLMIKNAKEKSKNLNNLKIDKIYISRRTWLNKSNLSNIGTNYTTRRKLMNEDDLVLKLQNNNYIEIFGENYSFIEKILLFNNAKEIIGSIGGTIVNCVFCNIDCKIICLVSPDFLRVNGRIKYSLINKKINYFEDTYLDCDNNLIPLNTRVKIKVINSKSVSDNFQFNNNIGEIENYEGNDRYLIKLSDGRNIGWDNDKKYKKIILNKNEFDILDYGLNSPWYINLNNLLI